MIVTLAPGRGSLTINKRGGFFTINPGEIKPANFALIKDQLENGTLVKALYPDIQNNEIVSVDTTDGKVRAIGKPKPRVKHGTN